MPSELRERPAEAARWSAPGPRHGRSGRPESAATVLVIDDEPDIRRFISRALLGHGFEVDCAGDGESGLALAKTGRYQLVVLDLLLPDSNGVSVLKAITAARPDQAVIVLSALSDVESKVRCLELGANDYLTSRSRSPS